MIYTYNNNDILITFNLTEDMYSHYSLLDWCLCQTHAHTHAHTCKQTKQRERERNRESERKKENKNLQEVPAVLPLLKFPVIKIIQSFYVLYNFSKIRVAPEVNNKARASCECQMWQQIALWCLGNKCLGSELSSSADTSIMYFFVKCRNVQSPAVLQCAFLTFESYSNLLDFNT